MYNHVQATFAVVVKNNFPTTGAPTTIAAGVSPLVGGDNISLGPYPLNSMYGPGSNVIVNEQQVCGYDISNYGDLILRL